MSLIDADPIGTLPALVVPHSRLCMYPRPHSFNCYGQEAELEDHIAQYLRDAFPRTSVAQQEHWLGTGIPDIVCRTWVGDFLMVTIIEVKRACAGEAALRQLERYVTAAARAYALTDYPVSVVGILAAFSVRARVSAPFGKWPMAIASA